MAAFRRLGLAEWEITSREAPLVRAHLAWDLEAKVWMLSGFGVRMDAISRVVWRRGVSAAGAPPSRPRTRWPTMELTAELRTRTLQALALGEPLAWTDPDVRVAMQPRRS